MACFARAPSNMLFDSWLGCVYVCPADPHPVRDRAREVCTGRHQARRVRCPGLQEHQWCCCRAYRIRLRAYRLGVPGLTPALEVQVSRFKASHFGGVIGARTQASSACCMELLGRPYGGACMHGGTPDACPQRQCGIRALQAECSACPLTAPSMMPALAACATSTAPAARR